MQEPFKKCVFYMKVSSFSISEKNLSGVFKKNGSILFSWSVWSNDLVFPPIDSDNRKCWHTTVIDQFVD
jgi:hypothetical protein